VREDTHIDGDAPPLEFDTVLYAYAGHDTYLEAWCGRTLVRQWSIPTVKLPAFRAANPSVRFKRKT